MRERARGKVEFSAETRRRQISLAETAGGEEEFPSRLEAKSSGQRAGGTFSHRHFSRVHRCYNSAVVHRWSYVSLGEGELKLNWRELRQGTLCFRCSIRKMRLPLPFLNFLHRSIIFTRCPYLLITSNVSLVEGNSNWKIDSDSIFITILLIYYYIVTTSRIKLNYIK